MERKEQLSQIIQSKYPNRPFSLDFAAADADFRRYWRATFDDGYTIICMDAPPDKMSIKPYLEVREIFASAVRVPEIYFQDEQNGFALLEDFGRYTYLQAMQQDERQQVHKVLLLEAIDTLIKLQKSTQANRLPEYSEQILRKEMQLFVEWFVPKELKITLNSKQQKLWQSGVEAIMPEILKQPKVYVHRDFIVRNLMLMKNQPGVLDFQDALLGPITYDLLSLTRDAFIGWDEEFVLDLVIRYWEKAKAENLPVNEQFDDFYRAYEFMGIQRHLKVIGIFARLKHRDNKEKYASEIPRFLKYLNKTIQRYSELAPFKALLTEICNENEIFKTTHGYSF